MSEIKVGDAVQYKAHTSGPLRGQRPGSEEPKRITYISDSWVAFNVHAADGRFLKEIIKGRRSFDEKMEKVKTENPLHIGQQYVNTTGKTVEIVARDTVYSGIGEVNVIAYRFTGGTGQVYLRATDDPQVKFDWTLITD